MDCLPGQLWRLGLLSLCSHALARYTTSLQTPRLQVGLWGKGRLTFARQVCRFIQLRRE